MVTVDGVSSLTIGSSTAGSTSSNVTMLARSRGHRVATALLGVAVYSCASSSRNSYSSSIVTVDGVSSLTIGSSTAGSTSSNVTMLAPSRRGNTATALLGVAVYSDTNSWRGSGMVTVDGGSSLTIGSSTAGSTSSNVTMLAPSSGYSLATALLGVAVHSHFGSHVSSHPSTSTVTICDTCLVSIHVLLVEEGTEVRSSAEDPDGTAAVAGIMVVGGVSSGLSVVKTASQSSGEVEAAESIVVDVWVGMQSRSHLSVGANETNAVVLGLVAPEFVGLRSEITRLALCIDEETAPPFASGGGVAMATNPFITGVEVTKTVAWALETAADSGTSGPFSLCSSKANAVQAELAGSLRKLTRLLQHLDNLPSWWWVPDRQPTTTSNPSTTKTPTASASLSLNSLHSGSTTVSRLVVANARPSVTLSSSQTEGEVLTPPTTREPSPKTPATPKRKVRITTRALLPSNEAAATVVLSTAGASGAVASTLGSGGAGVVVTAGSSVRMMECGLADDDPRPARFELPIQFPIGNGAMRYFAGAVLSHTLLQCVLFAVPVLLRRKVEGAGNKMVTLPSLVFCGAHPFFTPAVLGACSTVIFNDDDTLSLAVAGGSALVVATIHGVVTLAVHRGPASGLATRRVCRKHSTIGGLVGGKAKLEFKVCDSTTTTTTTTTASDDDNGITAPSDTTGGKTAFLFSAAATKDILLTLFDGCRHYEKVSHRHYSSIETTLYSVIAIISGARPQQNCNTAAFAIGLLATLQLAYLVLIRPFRTRLDMIFSVC